MALFCTTPAGITPFSNDPNWQRLASGLIKAGNGIGLDSDGALIYNGTGSGGTTYLADETWLHLNTSTHTFSHIGPSTTSTFTQRGSYVASYNTTASNPTLIIQTQSWNYDAAGHLIGTATGTSSATIQGVVPQLAGTTSKMLMSRNNTQSWVEFQAPLAYVPGTNTVQLQTSAIFFVDGAGMLNQHTLLPIFSGFAGMGLAYAAGLTLDGSSNLIVDTSIIASQTASSQSSLGTLSWTGTAPTGLNFANYRWVQIGKMVTVFFEISYTTNGVINYNVTFALPGGVPTPAVWTSQPNSTIVTTGSGLIAPNADGSSGLASLSTIQKDGSGNFNVSIFTNQTFGLNAKYAWACLNYLTA